MGLTISSLLTRLFGKKQMRILMGKVPGYALFYVNIVKQCPFTHRQESTSNFHKIWFKYLYYFV